MSNIEYGFFLDLICADLCNLWLNDNPPLISQIDTDAVYTLLTIPK